MTDKPHRLQSKTHQWYTPELVAEPVRRYFGGRIPLDPATSSDNPLGAATFYTAADDGLAQRWRLPAFVNPPYGSVFPLWCAKIAEEAARGQEVIALLPAGSRFSTKYFQAFMSSPSLVAVCWVGRRVPFMKPLLHRGRRLGYMKKSENIYDSAIYCFNGSPDLFRERFGELGVVWEIRSPRKPKMASGPSR